MDDVLLAYVLGFVKGSSSLATPPRQVTMDMIGVAFREALATYYKDGLTALDAVATEAMLESGYAVVAVDAWTPQ